MSPVSSDLTPETADRLVEVVLAVPGVHGLHAGVLGEAATYLPGRRVNGVKLKDDSCEVHVVLDWGSPILQTADDVRVAVEALVAGPVNVIVEDISAPTPSDPQPPEIKDAP